MRKTNKYFGWILVVGIILTQTTITIKSTEIGRMAPFIAILTSVIFAPYFCISLASLLNRKSNIRLIKTGVSIGVFSQVILPIFLPLFFDKELIYLSLIGILLGALMWWFRKEIEILLFILNIVGLMIWISITIATIGGYLF